MLIRNRNAGDDHPVTSDITPRAVYEHRRAWLRQVTVGAAGAALAADAGPAAGAPLRFSLQAARPTVAAPRAAAELRKRRRPTLAPAGGTGG